jgi:hypothetical protein
MSRGVLGSEASQLERGDDGVGGPVNERVVLGEPGFAKNHIEGINLSKHKVQVFSIVSYTEGGRGDVLSSLHDRTICKTNSEWVL